MSDSVCRFCGCYSMDHDYEQLARHCYPEQVKQLRAALRGMLTAATAPATCDEDWEAEIQEAERVLGVERNQAKTIA